MIRAAVLIGVQKTGGFPGLRAVTSGIEAIERWIVDQGDFGDRLSVIADVHGDPVTPDAIRHAIYSYVRSGTVEQLVVYFAGHGINVKYQEFWLLSDAPDDPQAAVNLAGSAALARHCGIPHVVFISDACRTAADTIRTQAVEGTIVFPNRGPRREPGYVDIFYAAGVGDPALELGPAHEATADFTALYTTALVTGLSGKQASIIEDGDQADKGFIRPWPLHRYLPRAMTQLLLEAGLSLTHSQVPDAVISSPPEAWLSQVPASRRTHHGLALERARKPQETLWTLSERTVEAALGNQPLDIPSLTKSASGVAGAALLAENLSEPEPPRPLRLDISCGFIVHGARIRRAQSNSAIVEIADDNSALVRVHQLQAPAANVLLEFDNGTGALLPAIEDLLGTLVMRDGKLITVSYDPSFNTDLWQRVLPVAPQLHALDLPPGSGGVGSERHAAVCVIIASMSALASIGVR